MVKNLEAAKELVELYRSITIEQLEEMYNKLYEEDDEVFFENILHEITGFGSVSSCYLCKPIGGRCPDCIHGQGVCTVASPCAFDETYENIIDAQSIEDLYDAIQDRADYLENLIKQTENGN